MTQHLTPRLLLHGYRLGIFPMAQSKAPGDVHWIEPRFRGVVPLERFHVSRSLAKTIRQGGYELRVDSAFRDVMLACADRPESWINPDILQAYCGLHAIGAAHSLEVWRDGALTGGLYGVRIGGAFFGESMFSRAPGESKIAMVHLAARLKAGGFRLLDTQFITDHLATFGAEEISRDAFQARLTDALEVNARFYPFEDAALSGAEIVQLATQTS